MSKRDPWGRLARIAFRKKDEAMPHDAAEAEAEKVRRQIDAGYAKTGKRARANNVRDGERAALVERFGAERLKGPLGKAFLNDCIAVLELKGFAGPDGGEWSHNTVRLLIKELRKVSSPPRPYTEPDTSPDDSDWKEWPDM